MDQQIQIVNVNLKNLTVFVQILTNPIETILELHLDEYTLAKYEETCTWLISMFLVVTGCRLQ